MRWGCVGVLVREGVGMNRGQSALEYLVTYGWVILVIALVGAVVWYFLFFSVTDYNAAKKCDIYLDLACGDIKVNSMGDLTVVLLNRMGGRISQIGLFGAASSCTPTSVGPGGNVTCFAAGVLQSGVQGDQFTSQVRGWYVDARSGINHTFTGQIGGKYESASFAEIRRHFAFISALSVSFDNGEVHDESPGGNFVGTTGSTPIYDPRCVVGGCFNFDGSFYFFSPNAPALQLTSSETIEFWVKPSSFSTSGVVWKAKGGEGAIELESDGTLNYYYGTCGGECPPYQAFSMHNPLQQGAWSHVALVRNAAASTIAWYLNGVKTDETSMSFPSAAPSSSNVTIGYGPPGAFRGEIDELRLYDRALPLRDIQTIYNGEKP